jgi:hypothetical protein
LILFGLAIDKSQPPVSEFWKSASSIFQLVGIGSIILAGILLDWVPVTSLDLYQVLQQTVHDDEKMAVAMQGMQIKRVKFLQMTVLEKLAYAFFLLNGIGLIVYAVRDFLGMIPEMVIPAANNERFVVSHWASASFTVLIAFICMLLAHITRTRFTDKWEERFKTLLREVEDDLGNLPG